MTKNLKEKPRTLSSWSLLEYKISGCTDARFLVQVTQEWNRLSQNPQNWSLLQALEKVRIIVVPFFFCLMKHRLISQWYGCVKEKINSFLEPRGSFTRSFFLAGVCNVKRLRVLLLSLGWDAGRWHVTPTPPPPALMHLVNSLIPIYTPRWRGTVGVIWLAQEPKILTQLGLKRDPLDLLSSGLTGNLCLT